MPVSDGKHQAHGEAEPGAVRPGALSALLEELVRAPQEERGDRWLEALRPGAVIGRFELVREVGRGGFGVVFEATDLTLGRSVALKAVALGERADLSEERALREAEAAARLTHPNIVTLYDVGRSAHGPYLVLELLHGRSLADRLGQGPMSVREAVRVAVEVARGVAHAHAQGVVHRDLKPENVFLCDDGQVKVLDFGLAQAFRRRKVEGGSPAYMAPEQWRGAPEDERTDVFALGVVLFEMLSGALPFPDDGGRAILGSRPPRALEVEGAPGVGELVAKMLSRDPVSRPRDAGEVLSALVSFQRELDRAPSAPAAARVRRRWTRRWALAIPVAAAVIAGATAAATLLLARGGRAPERAVPSIAVLPFVDMSPQHDQEYFSDGLSEEILNALAHVEGLRVAGRASTLAFKGKGGDLPAIRRTLHVNAVLEGSVRKAGDRVRITAQIVDLRDGFHLWSESYDRDLKDVFGVQDEIARAVVTALRVKLLPGQSPSTRELRTPNPEVYLHYLLARQLYARSTDEAIRSSAEEYEKAIALDPTYAPAWAGLAMQRFNIATMDVNLAVGGAALERQRDLAREAAEKAIALDPGLAEGYTVRALMRAELSWDWAGAQEDLERARALAPGDATVQRRYAFLSGALGRFEEAAAAARKATEIDPLFPLNWSSLASNYISLGQLGLAREALDRLQEIAPGAGASDRGWLALREGHPADALASYQRLPEGIERLVGVANAQHSLGRARESQEALDTLVARYGEATPTAVAAVHAWRGDRDAAFAWLEKAFARRDPLLVYIKHFESHMPACRGDPRFRDLLRRMKLPDD